MSDRILVNRIAVIARHGVLPEEERLGQRFFVSLDCRLDLREAGRTDDLRHSVDYAELVALAHGIAVDRRFYLIEALAHVIATETLARFPQIREAIVRIDKPGAPVPAVVEDVAVEVTRRRGE